MQSINWLSHALQPYSYTVIIIQQTIQSASDSISASMTDVIMRFITTNTYPFRLEQFQNLVTRATPGGLAVLYLRKVI